MGISRARTLTIIATAVAVLLVAAGPGHAIDKCKVKVDKKTGVIQVDASGVGGPLTWGSQSGSETNSFFNAGSCVAADKAKRCQLADPSTLASKTAPEGCTLYLADTTTPCSAWIPGCSPGARHNSSIVVSDANGLFIGNASREDATKATRDVSGDAVGLPILYSGQGFESYGTLYFTSADCSGSPIMLAGDALVLQAIVFGTTAYIPPRTGTPQTAGSYMGLVSFTTSQSACDGYYGPGTTFVAPNGCCAAPGYPATYGTASTLDLTPFAPPFKVSVD